MTSIIGTAPTSTICGFGWTKRPGRSAGAPSASISRWARTQRADDRTETRRAERRGARADDARTLQAARPMDAAAGSRAFLGSAFRRGHFRECRKALQGVLRQRDLGQLVDRIPR